MWGSDVEVHLGPLVPMQPMAILTWLLPRAGCHSVRRFDEKWSWEDEY